MTLSAASHFFRWLKSAPEETGETADEVRNKEAQQSTESAGEVPVDQQVLRVRYWFPFISIFFLIRNFFFFRISSLPSDKASHLLILVHLSSILLEYKKNLGLLY